MTTLNVGVNNPIPPRRTGTSNPSPPEQPPALSLGPDLPEAACKGLGGLFDDWVDTPTGHEHPTKRARRHQLAKAICGTCPAQLECLAARLADADLGPGVFGGRLFVPPPKRSGHRRTTRKPCKHCGTPFNGERRVYCTDDCFRAARAERALNETEMRSSNAKLPPLSRCQTCGKPLEGKRRSCGKTCRNRAAERRRQQKQVVAA